MKKFLIVDDHSLSRSGLKLIVSDLYPDSIICEAQNEEECLAYLKKEFFDIMFLDLNMPDSDSYSIVKFLLAKHPKAKIVIVTMCNEEIYGKKFLKAGVKGFVNKTSSNDEIKEAIEKVSKNKVYLSSRLKEYLSQMWLGNIHENPFEKLSEKEMKIMRLLLTGKTIQEISEQLNVTTSTVSTYKGRIFEKVSVPNNNIVALLSLARDHSIAF